jgi:hypothetical protein
MTTTRPVRAATFSVLALAIAMAAAGCGKDGGGASGPPDLTLFVGTWNVAVGQLIITCNDDNMEAFQVTQPTTFVMGSAADLLDSDATCPLLYDVTGNIARALPFQTCDDPNVITKMFVDEDTFTVDGNGMATHDATGHLQGFINITQGQSVKCTFKETGIYRRPAS